MIFDVVVVCNFLKRTNARFRLVAARMKTFTYQLSNLKYVEEGWTLKGPTDFEISSDEESELEEHIIIPRDISTIAFKVIEFIRQVFKVNTLFYS